MWTNGQVSLQGSESAHATDRDILLLAFPLRMGDLAAPPSNLPIPPRYTDIPHYLQSGITHPLLTCPSTSATNDYGTLQAQTPLHPISHCVPSIRQMQPAIKRGHSPTTQITSLPSPLHSGAPDPPARAAALARSFRRGHPPSFCLPRGLLKCF